MSERSINPLIRKFSRLEQEHTDGWGSTERRILAPITTERLGEFGLALTDTDVADIKPSEIERFTSAYTTYVSAEVSRKLHAIAKKIPGQIQREGNIYQEHLNDGSHFPNPAEAAAYLDRLFLELNTIPADAFLSYFDSSGEEDKLIAGKEAELAIDILGHALESYDAEIEDIREVAPSIKRDALERAKTDLAMERDPLTGLLNRSGITSFFKREMKLLQNHATPDQVLVVASFDLNSFKDINERLGHGNADQLLKQIGQVLEEELRPTDGIARTGGDEFVLVATMPRKDKSAFVAKVTSVVHSISYNDGTGLTPIQLSGGYYVVDRTDKSTSFEEAEGHSDEAATFAKLGAPGFVEYSQALFDEYVEILRDPEKRKDYINQVVKRKFNREMEELKRMDVSEFDGELDRDELILLTEKQMGLERIKEEIKIKAAIAEKSKTGKYGAIIRRASESTIPGVTDMQQREE